MRAIGKTPKTWPSLHKDRISRLLAINDLYVRLLGLRIPPEAIAERRDVLEDLQVAPQYTRLAMRVTGVDKQWLLYLREKGIRRKLLNSTNVVPGDLGHVVLYDQIPVQDVHEFLKQSVPRDYHVLTMDDLPLFETLAFEPEMFKARMGQYIGARYPGKMVRLESCPFDYAWERSDGARAVLADASANDLGPVKATLDLDIEYARDAGWGQGVVLFAKDDKTARLWLKVIGPREWLRLVRYDLPPKEAFFEAGDNGWRPF
jgi:hypothetical protein